MRQMWKNKAWFILEMLQWTGKRKETDNQFNFANNNLNKWWHQSTQ
jgi:hypothetical protein